MVDPHPRCLAERYRLDRPIGRGGMGEVWAGHDLRLGRPVAVKLLRPAMAQVAEARLRFEAEATAAAKLADPHVVAIFDTGEESSIPYIVMELLSGETLSDELRRGPLDAVETRQIADQLLSALAVAHRAGIVHRDVQPGNVLRAGPDTWKPGDFGIAKSLEAATELTMTGLVPGTPAYVAPERLDGEPATPSADLYSLGVVERSDARIPLRYADGKNVRATGAMRASRVASSSTRRFPSPATTRRATCSGVRRTKRGGRCASSVSDWVISVGTQPGYRMWRKTPSFSTSNDSASVKALTAAFDAA
jgi:serine/threonine protein kinase